MWKRSSRRRGGADFLYLAARARVALALVPQSGHNSAHDTLSRGILRSLEPLGARGHNDFASDGHGGVYVSASGVYDIKAPITGAVLPMSQPTAKRSPRSPIPSTTRTG